MSGQPIVFSPQSGHNTRVGMSLRSISRRGCLLLAPPALLGALGISALWPAARDRAGRTLAWYQDTAPPTVTIRVPERPVRGVAVVVVEVADAHDWTIESIDLDGTPLPAAAGEHWIDTAALPDGAHVVTVRARDRSAAANETIAQASFVSRNSGPRLDLDPRSTQVGQGQTLVVRVRTDVPAEVRGTLDGWPLHFVADGLLNWALAGFDAMTRPGRLRLALAAVDELGNRSEAAFDVAVTPVRYPNEEVWLPPATSGLIGSNVNAQEIARLDRIFAGISPVKRWEGPFLVPVPHPIVSEFATGRSYNGGPITSRHWGTDFDCPVGTPVAAAAAGTVVLADTLAVRGLAVILDHGLGVFSCYYHLSRADVRLGQAVDRGTRIGLSGASGAVTGPHLHWEVRVRGEAVDPMAWTRTTIP
ncbi:MAG: M23 family metallopeptidase [Chloroflexota bacterium]|nr:M23 family metallopeptidase [Dehalococcoidia bacterium]MDW8253110.1 M23 family metallopeptidase [Chloroflexota bacterium]